MMRRATTTIVMTLAWAAAAAQTIAEPEEAEFSRYTVEVIIFEYAEDVSVGTERFLPEVPPPGPDDVPAEGELVFSDTDAGVAVEDRLPDLGEPEFVLNAEDEFTMTDVASRLNRLDVYRPVMHFAWTQVTRPEEQTQPIDLQALAEPAEGLEGTFNLYLSRYLHLVVDLSSSSAPDLPTRSQSTTPYRLSATAAAAQATTSCSLRPFVSGFSKTAFSRMATCVTSITRNSECLRK